MTPISIEQTRRDIAQLQAEATYALTPNLEQLQNRVQHWTTQSILKPDLKGELAVACLTLDQARETVAANEARQARIRDLQRQLEAAEDQQRRDSIEAANAQLDDAVGDYLHAGKLLVRAYRAMLQAQRKNQQVPGAKSSVPGGFNFAPVNPSGWMGNTSDMMREGFLPFERKENER